MTFQYSAANLEELAMVANKIIRDAGTHRFFAIEGGMGLGKTTLVKAICNALNVEDMVSSPTFSIMNEYKRSNGEQVFHFDFYRINKESEAFDLGYENYFFSNYYCFVEWPEKIQSLLNFPKATIFITSENELRLLTMTID